MSDNITEDTVYTLKEVSQFLKISKIKIVQHIKKGDLIAHNVSAGSERKIYRITESNLKKFLSKRII